MCHQNPLFLFEATPKSLFLTYQKLVLRPREREASSFARLELKLHQMLLAELLVEFNYSQNYS